MEEKGSAYIIQDKDANGSIKIANEAISQIAGIATMEVEGIESLTGTMADGLVSWVGVKNMGKGVRCVMQGDSVHIDMTVTMKFGHNIPLTAKLVQEKVRSAVENMTGLKVESVNVRIDKVSVMKEN